jgi:hypothetical protein
LSLHRAVVLAAKMAEIFGERQIQVIRVGLQPSDDLAAGFLAGPHHPAFGELVKSRRLFNKVRALLHGSRGQENRRLSLAVADQSIFRGQKNYYLERLKQLGLLAGVDLLFREQHPRGEATLETDGRFSAVSPGHDEGDQALK